MDLFRNLGDHPLEALAAITRQHDYNADHYVISEGAPAGNIYSLVEGSLMITKENPVREKEPIYLGSIKPRELFGESSVLEGGIRTANVVTCSESTLLVMRRGDFLAFLRDYPATSRPILSFLVNQLVGKLSATNHEPALTRNRLYRLQEAQHAPRGERATDLRLTRCKHGVSRPPGAPASEIAGRGNMPAPPAQSRTTRTGHSERPITRSVTLPNNNRSRPVRP
ncbi:MAG: cyclic nucleotide-binding domain-containing protein [Candidatus Sedimenticola endophacoides]